MFLLLVSVVQSFARARSLILHLRFAWHFSLLEMEIIEAKTLRVPRLAQAAASNDTNQDNFLKTLGTIGIADIEVDTTTLLMRDEDAKYLAMTLNHEDYFYTFFGSDVGRDPDGPSFLFTKEEYATFTRKVRQNHAKALYPLAAHHELIDEYKTLCGKPHIHTQLLS